MVRYYFKGDILIDDRGKNLTGEFDGEWIQFGSDKSKETSNEVSFVFYINVILF